MATKENSTITDAHRQAGQSKIITQKARQKIARTGILVRASKVRILKREAEVHPLASYARGLLIIEASFASSRLGKS